MISDRIDQDKKILILHQVYNCDFMFTLTNEFCFYEFPF